MPATSESMPPGVIIERREIDHPWQRYRLAVAEFDATPADTFFNANRPEDLAQAAALLARLEGAAA